MVKLYTNLSWEARRFGMYSLLIVEDEFEIRHDLSD